MNRLPADFNLLPTAWGRSLMNEQGSSASNGANMSLLHVATIGGMLRDHAI